MASLGHRSIAVPVIATFTVMMRDHDSADSLRSLSRLEDVSREH